MISSSLQPNLANQAAVVTGAGRGIGRAIARRLAAETTALPGAIIPTPCNLTLEPDIHALFNAVRTRSGRLDVLINMGLTKSLAAETHPDIRVCAVLPGGVDTDMIRQARPDIPHDELLHPDDIADTVAFLLALPPRAAIDEIYIRRRSSKPF